MSDTAEDVPYVSPCSPPEGYERELTTVLIEECAEVQQRASKLLRFGVDEVQAGQLHSNAERLGHEVGDLLEVIELAVECGLVTASAIDEGRRSKRKQLAKYMQQSRHV